MSGGWTDAEKLQLLFSIIEAQGAGPIPWAKVNIPEGRTVKACTHVVAKLRNEAAGGGPSPAKPNGKRSSPKVSAASAAPSSTGKRKKSKDEAEDDDEPEEQESPAKKRRARQNASKKQENSGDQNMKDMLKDLGEIDGV